jgi:hypothetical protein
MAAKMSNCWWIAVRKKTANRTMKHARSSLDVSILGDGQFFEKWAVVLNFSGFLSTNIWTGLYSCPSTVNLLSWLIPAVSGPKL